MRKKQQTKAFQKIILFILAIGAIYGGYYWGNQHALKKHDFLNLSPLATPTKITPFQLQTQGGIFSESDLTDHWNLVIVGHAESESSPIQLTLAVQIHNRLADQPDLQKDLQVLFLDVSGMDTEIDQITDFVKKYNRDFLALTGVQQQIDVFTKQIGTRFKRTNAGSETHIDHSTSMALISPQAELIGLFTGKVDAVSIATDMKKLAQK